MNGTMNDMNKESLDEKPLYDPALLTKLDFKNLHRAKYDPEISPQQPGEGFVVRPLCRSDFDKGYIDLLSQLTKVGEITKEMFEERFSAMEACLDSYFITVIEDTKINQIVASGTLVKEQKVIRQCATRGRIEDIVVHNGYRKQQFGKLILDIVSLLGKEVGCYKLSLECQDELVKFYSKFGYIKEAGQNYMCARLKDI